MRPRGSGLHSKKIHQLAEKFDITCSEQDEDKLQKIKEDFLDSLLKNLGERLEQPAIVNALAVLNLSSIEPDMLSLYGLEEIETLGEHYHMDMDYLLDEWTHFKDLVVQELPGSSGCRSIAKLCALLCTKPTFNSIYPLLHQLYSVAATLPISTAEVERLFSAVKLVYTDHRASLHVKTVNRLLMIKLNSFERDTFPFEASASVWYTQRKHRID